MTVKNIVFGAVLATAVMTAGTPAGAQEPRRNVMVLDPSSDFFKYLKQPGRGKASTGQ